MARPSFLAAQTLLTIARLGTFTAAARQLNTTQSAISVRMRELEASLGYALFVRRGRNVQLSVRGQGLVQRLQPLMEGFDKAFQPDDSIDQLRGVIRIGLGELSIIWFGSILPRFHQEMPHLQLALDIGLSTEVQAGLEEGRLDLGLVSNPHMRADLSYEPLGTTSLRWYMASALMHTADGKVRPLDDLWRSELLWCLPPSSPFHAPSRTQLADQGADMAHLCTCSKLKGLLDIAVGGGGLVLLPEGMAKPHVESNRLALVSEALEPHPLSFHLAVDRHQSQRAVRMVADWLLAAARMTPL